MADPLGLIRSTATQGINPSGVMSPARADGPAFKDVLLKNLDEVNKLQQDATRAVEDLQTGKRNDLEGVMLATAKADTAFKALQAVRNRVMEAYDEVKQIRV
ncbi:MAG: flagellar hook-basal body complex protein FliE [Planctomycetota bacterium]